MLRFFNTTRPCDLSAPLTDGEEYGRLTSDPDIVQLDDGTLRLVCFGGGGSCTAISPPAGDGLLLALKEPT